jgi:hypothetical protein
MDKQKRSATEAEEHTDVAAAEAAVQVTVPRKGPAWSQEFGRVKATVWPADAKHAKPSVSICREYIDWKAKETKRVHYYDREDLLNVRDAANTAFDYLTQADRKV